ncbi:MAG: MotA/TolQ/ExbB proton channel family protein [Gemmatimonadetes bacterium]|nr:MAG: MotA/TolQ/ExbB proton channel family protein [Gemmatimonadota bacterium]
MIELVARAFQDGGVFMYLILAVSAVAVAITIERVMVIFLPHRTRVDYFINEIARDIRVDNLDKAIRYCRDHPTVFSRIILAGLLAFQEDELPVEDALEEATLAELPLLEARTPYLSMLAQIATLLGLLGTIIGLMDSFSAVGTASAAARAMELTQGISKAMNTTAFGLIVAIPCLIAYTVIWRRTERLLDDIDRCSTHIGNLLKNKK